MNRSGTFKSHNYDFEYLNRLAEEHVKAIGKTEEESGKWMKFKKDYEDLSQRLETLPHKMSYDIMVPFGSKAFMPGKMVHTNEILVLLGDNWFVDRSAKQAQEIISRRIGSIDKNLKELEQQKYLLTSRQEYTDEFRAVTQSYDDTKEIIEEYNEEKEKEWRVRHRKMVQEYHKQKASKVVEMPDRADSDDDLWKRLEELEFQETLGDEFKNLSSEESLSGSSHSSSPNEAKHITWEQEEDEFSSDDELDSDNVSRPNTIYFKHSENQPHTNQNEQPDTVVSPGDIAKFFGQIKNPLSILKKANDQSLDSYGQKDVKKIAFHPDRGDCFESEKVDSENSVAFKSEVHERTGALKPDSMANVSRSSENDDKSSSKRMSKFRSQRMQMNK